MRLYGLGFYRVRVWGCIVVLLAFSDFGFRVLEGFSGRVEATPISPKHKPYRREAGNIIPGPSLV